MQQCQLVFKDQRTGESRRLFKIRLATNTRCLYFIDGCGNGVHLSFHKDNSVWFTPNTGKGAPPTPPKLLLAPDSFVPETLSAFLVFKPESFSAYPTRKKQPKGLEWVIVGDQKDISTQVFACCVVSSGLDQPISTEVRRTIDESGLLRIGTPVEFNGRSSAGVDVSGVTRYRPFLVGNHAFHIDLRRAEVPVLPGVGVVTFTRMHNPATPQYLLEATTMSDFGTELRPPWAKLRSYKSGGLELCEIAYS